MIEWKTMFVLFVVRRGIYKRCFRRVLKLGHIIFFAVSYFKTSTM
jgi:hypothetical protein